MKRFKSINFILWMSFLAFAGFILMLTWVFQTALLRTFIDTEIKEDLNKVGKETYEMLVRLPQTDEIINNCIALQEDDNHSADIYILDYQTGEILYPTTIIDEKKENSVVQYGVDVKSQLQDKEYGSGVILNGGRNFRAYVTKISVAVNDKATDACLYVNYSTAIADNSLDAMRLQLTMIALIVIFVALIISGVLSIELTKPISQITRAAKRMATGDFSVDFQVRYSYAEMNALAETLNYAKEEIGRADELQKEVLANVTHDLKTPLTMIKAYASMIQEISGDNPEKREKHTQVIIDEADRLTSLVNDILKMSKIRTGMDTLNIEEFNLSEFIHTILERFGFLSETQGYTIIRDIDDELYTKADKDKIEQVIYNLIGNAVNYTGEDKKITVSLKAQDKLLRFAVTDTGKGIPPEESAAIWDRYYRLDETHKRPIQGTGLGLSIVKTILVKHGFKFGVESEVGKGSTFFVEFPNM